MSGAFVEYVKLRVERIDYLCIPSRERAPTHAHTQSLGFIVVYRSAGVRIQFVDARERQSIEEDMSARVWMRVLRAQPSAAAHQKLCHLRQSVCLFIYLNGAYKVCSFCVMIE